MAYADFNGDGCLDLFVANMGLSTASGGPVRLFQNRCDWGNNWLVVKTLGTTSNRNGIGARITVITGDRRQIREVTAGASNSSQNMLPAHFGLGQEASVDEIRVSWPSGVQQTLESVPANQALTVVEP